MGKIGRKNKVYSAEFKIGVIIVIVADNTVTTKILIVRILRII